MECAAGAVIFIFGCLFVQYMVLITAGIHVDGLSQGEFPAGVFGR